jgi:hydroxymethylglutaryl-CoA reductase
MDIQEARKLKWDLQTQILELLKKYEEKTYGHIKSISVEHSYSMGIKDELVSVHIEVHV